MKCKSSVRMNFSVGTCKAAWGSGRAWGGQFLVLCVPLAIAEGGLADWRGSRGTGVTPFLGCISAETANQAAPVGQDTWRCLLDSYSCWDVWQLWEEFQDSSGLGLVLLCRSALALWAPSLTTLECCRELAASSPYDGYRGSLVCTLQLFAGDNSWILQEFCRLESLGVGQEGLLHPEHSWECWFVLCAKLRGVFVCTGTARCALDGPKQQSGSRISSVCMADWCGYPCPSKPWG